MSATQTGVRESSQRSKDLEFLDQKDLAKQRAEFEAADQKTIADLPEDHPIKVRQSIMDTIEAANAKNQGYDDETVVTPPVETKPEPISDVDKQVAAQTELIIDDDMLKTAKVRVRIYGVEELVPASKVLGQYQKGAAADVRLAQASKAVKDAEAKASEILSAARATPATPAEPVAQVKADPAKANAKFKEASEALFSGDSDRAAELFSEATALAMTPTTERRADPSAIDSDALVSTVVQSVKQQLSTDSALEKLFVDYPEIKAKRAFSLMADEYIVAFEAAGKSRAEAIALAGDALGEEYKLGKYGQQPTGRQIESDGPTTRTEKLNAKKGLDVVTSGNARATSLEVPELTPAQIIAEMAAARPGAR